jgi:hypothetical protein
MTKLLIMHSPPPSCYQAPVVQISSSAPYSRTLRRCFVLHQTMFHTRV